MVQTPGEQEAIVRRIARIDAELESIQRQTAIQDVNYRDKWDDLFRERALLVQRITPASDNLTSPWYLRLLSASLVVVGSVLYCLHSDNAPWLAAWFVLGLACGGCLIAFRRTTKASAPTLHAGLPINSTS